MSGICIILSSQVPLQGAEEIPSYPKTIAGLQVTSVRDLTIGYDSSNPPTYKPTLPLSSGHMIQFRAESAEYGTRITLTIRCASRSANDTALIVKILTRGYDISRTSGTEPKVRILINR